MTFSSLLEVRTPIAFSYLADLTFVEMSRNAFSQTMALVAYLQLSQGPMTKICQHRPQIAKTRPMIAHQHLKQHPPKSSTCQRTRPAISQKCARTITSTRNSTPPPYTSTPDRMSPSTQPSISPITFPSLLECRTPVAFRYLGNNQLNCGGQTTLFPQLV